MSPSALSMVADGTQAVTMLVAQCMQAPVEVLQSRLERAMVCL